MERKNVWKTVAAGFAAGAVTGMFGTGGGMVLVPLLRLGKAVPEEEIFGSSVAIILPVCIVSIMTTALAGPLPWQDAFPYMLGSLAGGIGAGLLGKRISHAFLHRLLGILILWGGIRYLWMAF